MIQPDPGSAAWNRRRARDVVIAGGRQNGKNRMLEAHFQSRITDLCNLLHLKWHHEVDSRKSKSGFPDLVISGPGGVLFAELKKHDGRVSTDQRAWANSLAAGGAEVHIWRPDDWPAIYTRLHELAGRPTPRSTTP